MMRARNFLTETREMNWPIYDSAHLGLRPGNTQTQLVSHLCQKEAEDEHIRL